MRIASANIFCLNVKPQQAIEAVAQQQADVTLLIESTPRFERHLGALPPVRATGLTRQGGMPISVHASRDIRVSDAHESGAGWFECRTEDVLLLAVHAIAPYLPWRWRRRRAQLAALARRLRTIAPNEHALALGDFNTSNEERAWTRLADRASTWHRLNPETDKWRGTWPLGGMWAPIALDHALAPPHLVGDNGLTKLRTFRIPGSDHMGLVVDLPQNVVRPQDAREAG